MFEITNEIIQKRAEEGYYDLPDGRINIILLLEDFNRKEGYKS